MPIISIRLLQAPGIAVDGSPMVFPFKKAEALVYCLALKKSVSREQIASLLWDTDDTQVSKKNLRHTLYTIKKMFGFDLIVAPQKQTLLLNPDYTYEIDYDAFLESGDFSLYEGELLQGFALKNAAAFESWLEMERIQVKDSYLRELYAAMVRAAKSNVSQTEYLFSKYTKEDPLDERVYQIMMECYAENKLYHKGIKVYQALSKLLNSELRIAPCAELTQLHRQLLRAWDESSGGESEAEEQQIIGRDAEMQFLMKAYHSFLLGAPVSILLSGDNGVGKTHLVNHFLGTIGEESCLVLKAICFQSEHDFILQPWNTIMLQIDQYVHSHHLLIPDSYISHINSLFPMFGDQHSEAQVPDDLMTAANYRTTRNSILKLFGLLGEEMPTILFFDNFQFMDSFSLELLSLIIREQNPNILCVLTATDVLPPHLQRLTNALFREKFLSLLTLLPFSEEAVKQIVEQRLGAGSLDAATLHHIYEDSEGNGFFIDMVLNYLSEDHLSSVNTKLPKPENILLERLDDLSVEARQMLDTISVCSESIPLEIIEFIFNRNTLEIIDLTDDLKQHNLIREKVSGGQIRFQFRHAKMQDFVHSLLSPAKRRLLHARVATYYEQTPGLAHNNSWYQSIIKHYGQAGNEAKVLQYQILALSDYSRFNYELYPILQPAQDNHLEAPKQIVTYFEELTAQLERLYQYQPNSIDFAEAETILFLVIAKYCIAQGIYPRGLEAIHRSLSHPQYLAAHPQLHINCLRQFTFYGIQVWDLPLMEENITRSMAIAKENFLNVDYAIECRLYGLYLSMCGEYQKSTEQLQLAIELFSATPLEAPNHVLNLAASYNYLGECERKQSHFAAALPYYEKAIAMCSDRKYQKNPTFFANYARTLLAMGEKERAEAFFFQANKLYDSSNIHIGRAITKGYCSIFCAEKGKFSEARKLLLEGEESAQRIQYPFSLGLMEQCKYILLTRYGNKFSGVIGDTADNCYQKFQRHLENISGAYELFTDFPQFISHV